MLHFFPPNTNDEWQMMTFLRPLDALIPKIPVSFCLIWGPDHLREPGGQCWWNFGGPSIEPFLGVWGGGGLVKGLPRHPPPPPKGGTERCRGPPRARLVAPSPFLPLRMAQTAKPDPPGTRPAAHWTDERLAATALAGPTDKIFRVRSGACVARVRGRPPRGGGRWGGGGGGGAVGGGRCVCVCVCVCVWGCGGPPHDVRRWATAKRRL